MKEDVQLTVWSNKSMLSEAFEGFYLSDLEYGVRTHHDHLRKPIPVLGLETAPEEKDMWALNDALRSRSGSLLLPVRREKVPQADEGQRRL